MYVCMYVCRPMYVCMYACMYVCVYICMYVYMYVFMYVYSMYVCICIGYNYVNVCDSRILSSDKPSAKQKTRVVKHSCNPQWQGEFVFKSLSRSELTEKCLELIVWDHDRFSNDFLGGTRLGLGSGIFS